MNTILKLAVRGWIALAVAVVLPAQRPTGDVLGAANRWTTYGGSPTRSGATHTRGLRGGVEIAWAVPLGGKLEGEPLVWDDTIVVSVARSGDQRVLKSFDRVTGKPRVTDRIARTELPLEPALSRDVVVYRSAPNQLMAARVGKTRMSEIWSVRTEGEFGPPLVIGDRVWVVADHKVHCYAIGRGKPLWVSDGVIAFGRLAYLDDMLYAVARQPMTAGIAVFHAGSGNHNCEALTLPVAPRDGASVTVLACGVFADFGGRIQVESRRDLRIAGCALNDLKSRKFEPLPGSIGMLSLPVAHGGGWMAKLVDKQGERSLCAMRDPELIELHELASKEHHSEYARDDLPVSIAGGVVYAGARAFEAATGRVLWTLPIQAEARPVPMRDGVLLVDDGGARLVAVRSRVTADVAVLAPSAAVTDVTGTLVARDGSVETGTFGVDASAGVVTRAAEKSVESWPLDQVLWLEDGELRGVLGADPVRGIELMNDAASSAVLSELLKKSRGTNDPDLIEELAVAAALRGEDDKSVASALKTVDELRERRPPAVRREKLSAELRDKARALDGQHVAMLTARLVALPDGIRTALDTKFLRALLQLDPKHALAVDTVRALLPESLRTAGEFDALDALAYVEVTRRVPVTFVAAPQKVEKGQSRAQKQIGQRLSTWRKDLYGVQSENLLIVTPVKRLGALARCIATGELVCTMLTELIANGAPPREEGRTLVIELYESREEYMQKSGHGRGQAGEFGADLGWTAGHFDARDDVTRFFFPEDEAEFDQALSTAAHEMTHHWLYTRCPLWQFRPLTDVDFSQPGYWVVEGFASFIDEFEFDLARGTWRVGGAGSRRLDLVASAGQKQRMPWELQLALSHAQFSAIPPDIEIGVPLSRRLGSIGRATVLHLFYAQAAATVQYLWQAEEGALRPKLIEFLRAYYSGERGKLALHEILGATAEELGQRITEHARKSL